MESELSHKSAITFYVGFCFYLRSQVLVHVSGRYNLQAICVIFTVYKSR